MNYTLIWDVDPEIVPLYGSVSLRYYSLCFVTGLIISYTIVRKWYKKEGISMEALETLSLYIYFGIIIGARLGHCLFYEPDYFLSRPLEMFFPIRINNGVVEFIGYQGLASHGGILGVLIAIGLHCYRYKMPILATLDKIAVVGPLAGCFIRLGNFMNSEIIGVPTNGNYGVVFKRVDDLPRHPTQLYEAISYFFLFIILWWLYRKGTFRQQKGLLFGLCLAVLFSIRFLLEFFKLDQVAFEEGMILNMGQWLSIPLIVVGILVIIGANRYR